MTGKLEGKAALVTGAGRGIGRAIAQALAREGAAVVLVSRTAAELAATASRIRDELGDRAPRTPVLPADVSDEGAVKQLVAQVRAAFGRLDVLVNNAGIGVRRPLLETPVAEWDRLMAVNARGPFLLCREAVPLLRDSGGGVVINIASVVAVKGYAHQAAYTASKHALMGMSKVLAQEVRPYGIRVHVVCPGGVATQMAGGMRPDLDPTQLIAPEEIAEIVLFLVTQRGNAVIDEVHVRRAAAEPWF